MKSTLLQARFGRRLGVVTSAMFLWLITACGGQVAPNGTPYAAYLMITNAGASAVEVLATRGRYSDLAPVSRARLVGVLPCGVAEGPDGRLYVADRARARVLVYERDALVAGGSVVPTASLTSAAMTGACGLAFDGEGALWVADQRGSTVATPMANALHRFDDVSGLVGDVDLTPSRTLVLDDDAERVIPSWFVSHLHVDDAGALWFSDAWRWSVSRLDDPTSFPLGTSEGVVPDLQFDDRDPDDPARSRLHSPQALARDGNHLFVATAGRPWVVRYDVDALPSGRHHAPEPDAVITLPLTIDRSGDGPVALAFDPTGALWIAANDRYRLLRVPDPAGEPPPRPTIVRSWGDRGLLFGSAAVFVSAATP